MTEEVKWELAAYLESEGRGRYFQLKQDKQWKLFRLKVWAVRHRISIREVLGLLLPVLRKVIKPERKMGLGVPIGLLCSVRAHEILVDRLAKVYPHGENMIAWKEEERERQLQAEHEQEWGNLRPAGAEALGLLDVSSVQKYLRVYSEEVEETQEEMAKACRSKKRRRKAYRNNPWL